MNIDDFKDMVARRSDAFCSDTRNSEEELSAAEQAIGHSLPESLKWLLTQYGYSDVCGIDSLKNSVEATIRCRSAIELPDNVFILNDWGDAGVVYLDYSGVTEGEDAPVLWVDTHDLYRLSEGLPFSSETYKYDNYSAWVANRLSEHDKDEL